MTKNKKNTLLSETNSYLSGIYTDQYQLAMSQAYFLNGMHNEKAVFDYFFRKLPFDGGYAVFAGLETLLETLHNLRFDEKDIRFLKELGLNEGYIEYLKDFKFRGKLYSVLEGEIVFSGEPVVRVEA